MTDNYHEAVNDKIKERQAAKPHWYNPRSLLRRLRRFIFILRHRPAGSRVVIVENRTGFTALMQSRRFLIFWTTANRTEEFKHFTSLLIELGDWQARIMALRGQPISRQARRRFAFKTLSKVTR